MKHISSNLTKEEQEIEDAFARGEYTQVPNFQERKIELQAAARYTLAKNKVHTIHPTYTGLSTYFYTGYPSVSFYVSPTINTTNNTVAMTERNPKKELIKRFIEHCVSVYQ